MERYLAAAQKISRVAVGDRGMGPVVNIHVTPVRQPQERRQENLPFGTRGGFAIDYVFPVDGIYEFSISTGTDAFARGVIADPERLEHGGQLDHGLGLAFDLHRQFARARIQADAGQGAALQAIAVAWIATIAGIACGMITERRMRNGPAPSIIAASSSSRGMERKYWRSRKTL